MQIPDNAGWKRLKNDLLTERPTLFSAFIPPPPEKQQNNIIFKNCHKNYQSPYILLDALHAIFLHSKSDFLE